MMRTRPRTGIFHSARQRPRLSTSRRSPFTFVSLFTGIGGMDLGLERAGFRCVAQVEIDAYCRSVLSRHWPRVPKFTDVRRFTRSCIHGPVSLVAGGFPCQDISSAGRKVGINGARSGLWKEFLRIVRSFRPPLVLVENVSALRSRGLDVVLSDLATCGYDAQWDCIPAAAVGAPHLRDRVFIVAHPRRLGRGVGPEVFDSLAADQLREWVPAVDSGLVEIAGRAYRNYPERVRVGDGSTPVVDRIRGCGNAVVPQVAEQLGRKLVAYLAADQVIGTPPTSQGPSRSRRRAPSCTRSRPRQATRHPVHHPCQIAPPRARFARGARLIEAPSKG